MKKRKFLITISLAVFLLAFTLALDGYMTHERRNPPKAQENPVTKLNDLAKGNTNTVYKILPPTEILSGELVSVTPENITIRSEEGLSFDYPVPENIILNCVAKNSTINVKELLLNKVGTSESSLSLSGTVPSDKISYIRQELKKSLQLKLPFFKDGGRILIERNTISVMGMTLNSTFDLVTLYLDDPKGCREN